MKILIDTHVLLWALGGDKRLTSKVRSDLEDQDNVVLFSAVSILEIAIKRSLDRVDFQVSPREILETAAMAGFVELPVYATAALAVAALPLHHRDPFDRLLVGQAMTEEARLYTADAKLESYSALVVRI